MQNVAGIRSIWYIISSRLQFAMGSSSHISMRYTLEGSISAAAFADATAMTEGVEDEVEEKQDSEDRIISRQNCERAVLAIIGHKHPATKDAQSGHGV